MATNVPNRIFAATHSPEAFEVMSGLGVKFYKAVAGAESVLFIPSGWIVLGRAVGDSGLYGFRYNVVEDTLRGDRAFSF